MAFPGDYAPCERPRFAFEPAARPAPLDTTPLADNPVGALTRSLTARAADWRAELPARHRLGAARSAFRAHANLRRARLLIDAWRYVAAAETAAASAAALVAELRALDLACSSP